jgi:hypothetical protein
MINYATRELAWAGWFLLFGSARSAHAMQDGAMIKLALKDR